MTPTVQRFSDLFFSSFLSFLFRHPAAARTRFARKLIQWTFGKLVAPHYSRVIRMYGPRYGAPLARGLEEIRRAIRRDVRIVVDCGTGTGYVSQELARSFAGAQLYSIDAVRPMLLQARDRYAAE